MKVISRSVGVVLVLAAFTLAGAATAQPRVKQLSNAKPEMAPAEAGAAQEKPPKPAAPLGPEDEFDRGVPRTSVAGFQAAADVRDWERAAEYLDLRNLPRGLGPDRGAELAHHLKVVLDRGLWIDLELVSDHPKGHADDELPSYRDYLGRIEAPETKVDVLLQRVPRGDGVFIWKFSNATLAEVPELYAHYGFGRLGEMLSELLPARRLLGIPLWEWGGLLVLGFGVFFVAWLTTAAVVALLRRTGGDRIEALESALRGPVCLLLFALLFRSSTALLGPTVGARGVLEAKAVLIAILAWVAMRVGDLVIEHFAQRLRRRGQAAAAMLGRPARNFVRGLVLLVALVVLLDNLGFKVTTLLAGFGIGGIAVALAAQRSIEDLIGAFTIYSTQPVRVGDFCRFGEKLGTVEEIGLRSTRVRTLDDTVVSVPNGEFSKLHLDNFGQRRKIWYHPRIRLRTETTPEQIRYVLVEVRKLLYAHAKVLPDPARIRFVGLGTWSLDLEVFAYVDTREYGEYLEIAEDLNLRIMQIVAEAGSGFAVPAQRTYLEPGAGLDAERAGEAEARVGEWREQSKLYLPRFPEEVVADLRGSVPYPPAGSPEANEGTKTTT